MRVAILLAAVLVTATPATARAEPTSPDESAARFRALFNEGQKLFTGRQYKDALSRFERLYALKPHPSVLFNIARCYEQMQETGRALHAYREYLRLSPDAKDRALVVDTVTALEGRLRKRGVSQLMVYTEPPGARVRVDGKELGESPASAELLPGAHEVVVGTEGYREEKRTLETNLQRSADVTITLARESAPAASKQPQKAEAPAAVTGDALPAAALPSADVATAAQRPGAQGLPWAPIAATGVAVAGAGVGGAFLWSSFSTADRYRSANFYDQRPDLMTQANAQALVGNIALGVAGAAAVTAVVLFVMQGGKP